jgi:hypothetical protein
MADIQFYILEVAESLQMSLLTTYHKPSVTFRTTQRTVSKWESLVLVEVATLLCVLLPLPRDGFDTCETILCAAYPICTYCRPIVPLLKASAISRPLFKRPYALSASWSFLPKDGGARSLRATQVPWRCSVPMLTPTPSAS